MTTPEKQPKDDPKPELGAILPDSTPPPSPADVFSDLDDYQKRIEKEWASTKSAYNNRINEILESFSAEAAGTAGAPPEPPAKPVKPPVFSEETAAEKMERLLARVERTLRAADIPPRDFHAWDEPRPSLLQLGWSPTRERWRKLFKYSFILIIGTAAIWAGVRFVTGLPMATALPYVHPSTLVFADGKMYIVDWFRKALYHHALKKNFPILQVENIPNNFITGVAMSDKTIWTLDGFNRQILQHSTSNDHRVLKSYPAPGEKPTGLFYDGQDLWSADSSSKKIFRHYGTDPETIKTEYGFANMNVTSIYYRENRLWILDGKSRMVYLCRLEDPLRVLETYDLDPILKGASPTDLTSFEGRMWMLTENPPQVLRLSQRDLKKLKVN